MIKLGFFLFCILGAYVDFGGFNSKSVAEKIWICLFARVSPFRKPCVAFTLAVI